jgi:general stress protein YciG
MNDFNESPWQRLVIDQGLGLHQTQSEAAARDISKLKLKTAPINAKQAAKFRNQARFHGFHVGQTSQRSEHMTDNKEGGSPNHRGGRGNFAEDRARAAAAGSKGGKVSGGNFANNRARASEAGRKGGQHSRGGGRGNGSASLDNH